jgi:DNA-binding NarL/FixJ family response regulator
MTIRVLLVDDQELLREGLAMMLDAQSDIEVVGQANDGAAGVAAAKRLDVCRRPARSWPLTPLDRVRG